MSSVSISCAVAAPTPSLASLIQRYWEECDASPELDENGDVNPKVSATLSAMVGVPVASAEDALTALDWLLADGVDLGRHYDPAHLTRGTANSAAVTSIIHALRHYLAEGCHQGT